MLTLTNIHKSFPGNFKPVLTDINLTLKPGDFCVVIGSNGSGKSTLMKVISGEYTSDAGHISLENQDVTKLRRNHAIAYVTQDIEQGTIVDMTLLENMILSLSRTKKNHFSFYRHKKNHVIKAIQPLNLGLERYIDTPLKQLSGGQRQMIATIMAVTSKPKILLLDEHTSALDPCVQQVVMAYTAHAIATQQLCSLMITHHLADAIQYGNRLIMLHQGQIVLDISATEKKNLTITQLVKLFHRYEAAALLEESL